MFYVYVGCLTFGTLYAVLAAVLGSHGFDQGDVDIGDAVGHEGGDSADMPSPFNPVVIASAIATFGAAGIIAKSGFRMGEILSSIFALGCAAIVGALVFFGIVKVLYSSQSNSNFSSEDLVNWEVEVFTPIPAHGVGEVVYVINGVRHSLPARSKYQELIERGEKVIIRQIQDHTAYVTRKMTINELCVDDYEVMNQNESQSEKRREENI